MKDNEFERTLGRVEKRAWTSFVALCQHFLGNHKSQNYKSIVEEFLNAYAEMGCKLSIKINFIHSHLDFFPDNLGQLSDEQGERFHREIAACEERFAGKVARRCFPAIYGYLSVKLLMHP